VDFFERRQIPFTVGVNCFDGAPRYEAHEVREALDVDERVPIVLCDVRTRESSKQVLVTLLEYLLTSKTHPAVPSETSSSIQRRG
ncbi:MAG: hypothetical protein ABR608_03725, partial [Pseudonocardiaceae bacterium]